jgi:hypothetical protein
MRRDHVRQGNSLLNEIPLKPLGMPVFFATARLTPLPKRRVQNLLDPVIVHSHDCGTGEINVGVQAVQPMDPAQGCNRTANLHL